MNQTIRDALCDMGHEDAVIFDGPDYDDAIVGVTDEGQVVYDYDAMVQSLMKQDGISMEEAIDFIEYNTIRALEYMNVADARGKPPIVMNRLNLEDYHGTD